MSYILEALKKLEQERARTRRESDPLRRLVQLDASQPSHSTRVSTWLKMCAALGLACMLVAGTYLVTRHVLVSRPKEYASEKGLAQETPEKLVADAVPQDNRLLETSTGPGEGGLRRVEENGNKGYRPVGERVGVPEQGVREVRAATSGTSDGEQGIRPLDELPQASNDASTYETASIAGDMQAKDLEGMSSQLPPD